MSGAQAEQHLADGQPVVSVDTKKELVGRFANGGQEWQPSGEPEAVSVHDFPDPTLGKAIPYGVYILPASIAARLKQGEDVIADAFPEVTVLFADLVDFTRSSQQIAPAQVVQFLNELFSVFDQLAQRHGLEKIKTIGDAYMVAGGLPQPRPDHAQAVAEMAWRCKWRSRGAPIPAASRCRCASASTPARWRPG